MDSVSVRVRAFELASGSYTALNAGVETRALSNIIRDADQIATFILKGHVPIEGKKAPTKGKAK